MGAAAGENPNCEPIINHRDSHLLPCVLALVAFSLPSCERETLDPAPPPTHFFRQQEVAQTELTEFNKFAAT